MIIITYQLGNFTGNIQIQTPSKLIPKKKKRTVEWFENVSIHSMKWDKVFKNEPSKICGRQHLKNSKGYGLLKRPYVFKFFKGCLHQILLGPLLKTLSQIKYVSKAEASIFPPTNQKYAKYSKDSCAGHYLENGDTVGCWDWLIRLMIKRSAGRRENMVESTTWDNLLHIQHFYAPLAPSITEGKRVQKTNWENSIKSFSFIQITVV